MLSVWLGELGQQEEGLAAIKEAVEIRRTLTARGSVDWIMSGVLERREQQADAKGNTVHDRT